MGDHHGLPSPAHAPFLRSYKDEPAHRLPLFACAATLGGGIRGVNRESAEQSVAGADFSAVLLRAAPGSAQQAAIQAMPVAPIQTV